MSEVIGGWTPPLRLDERSDGCRLTLVGLTHGDGGTLQAAADDLVAKLLSLVMSWRNARLSFSSEVPPPDPRLLEFLWELGDLAGRGEDIRPRVFGSEPEAGGAP